MKAFLLFFISSVIPKVQILFKEGKEIINQMSSEIHCYLDWKPSNSILEIERSLISSKG